ncbi:MAG: LytTR family DNA-binding domain-containing protein [Tissierellia bacterium]|nr:LytTR family DNA-binding domain-containing protein [Tissierellia bacterium]
MIKIAVVEDEKSILEKIKFLIDKNIKNIKNIEVEYFDYIPKINKERKYDIYLLDIQVGNENSIDLAKKIREYDFNSIIIFITSFNQYVTESYDIGAFHYLVKPINEEKFDKILSKAITKVRDKGKIITIPDKGFASEVNTKDIIYIDMIGGETKVYLLNGNILSSKIGIKKALNILNDDYFIKISKSTVINFRYFKSVDFKAKKIFLKTGEELYPSKREFTRFTDILKILTVEDYNW